MTEPNPETVADRLAAAGVRVKPLVWKRSCSRRYWHTNYPEGNEWTADSKQEIESLDTEYILSVLAMLEVVPSEEPQP